MSRIDRNRIDRVPTKWERRIGVALAAVASAVFLALFGLGLYALAGVAADRTYAFWFVGVTGFMAAGCAFLLYRLIFTEPRAASARTSRIIWTGLAAVMAAAFVLSLMSPAPRAVPPMLGMLSILAISRMLVASAATRGSRSGSN